MLPISTVAVRGNLKTSDEAPAGALCSFACAWLLCGLVLAGVVVRPATAQDPTPRFLTEARSGDPLDIALDYVFGGSAASARFAGAPAPDEYTVESRHTSAISGSTHIVLRQRLAGRDVLGGEVSVHVSRDGEIMAVHDRFASAAKRRAAPSVAQVSALEAIAAAASAAGLPSVTPTLLPSSKPTQQLYDYGAPSLSRDPIRVRLAYRRSEEGELQLVWELHLRTPDRRHYWHTLVDAVSGVVLERSNWVRHDSYRVFASPLTNPDDGPRSLEVDPSDSTASPFGWHDDDGVPGPEFTDTRGNNTWAQEDTNFDNSGGVRPSGGATLDFNPSLNLAGTPLEQQAAAVTNLFYWTNWLHDAFYAYGFDEAAGNFQTNNYGRGGLGGDLIFADAQDGDGTNNATFLTLPDGQASELQMFLFLPAFAEVQVSFPASIAAGYPAGTAEFGSLPAGQTAEIVAAIDAVEVGGTATDGCSPLSNGSQVVGRIALIDRGLCLFVDKVKNAQVAGAVGVIIANNNGNQVLELMRGIDASITIPSVFVGESNGRILRDALGQGVQATLVLSSATWRRDSSFSNVLVAHEYTHGVTTRLTGGAASVTCLDLAQASGMGEGWSDFFGIALTAKASDTRTTRRTIGTFVSGEPLFGAGFRNYQFSTDLEVNPQSYSDIVDALIGGLPSEHGIGEIWATALWEIYWNLVDEYGFDADLVHGSGGNNLMMQLVMDGLPLQACEPTFLEARDAILLADQALTGGENECAIWQGFAKRGMGVSANDGGSAAVTEVSDGFDVPMACPEPSGGVAGFAALLALAGLRRRRATC